MSNSSKGGYNNNKNREMFMKWLKHILVPEFENINGNKYGFGGRQCTMPI